VKRGEKPAAEPIQGGNETWEKPQQTFARRGRGKGGGILNGVLVKKNTKGPRKKKKERKRRGKRFWQEIDIGKSEVKNRKKQGGVERKTNRGGTQTGFKIKKKGGNWGKKQKSSRTMRGAEKGEGKTKKKKRGRVRSMRFSGKFFNQTGREENGKKKPRGEELKTMVRRLTKQKKEYEDWGPIEFHRRCQLNA